MNEQYRRTPLHSAIHPIEAGVSEIVTFAQREYHSLKVRRKRLAAKYEWKLVQLTFDDDVEAFRSEFAAFLDEHAPSDADAVRRPHSSAHMPDWARSWQRLLFDNGWLVPGNPPAFGGRNATLMQQYVHQTELARR